MPSLLDQLVQLLPFLAPVVKGYPGLVWLMLWLAWAGVIMGFISVYAMFTIWVERRVAGRIQARQGPNRVGPFGLLQSVADGIKLLLKEDLIPSSANRFLFTFAPLVVFAGTFIPFVVLPFSQELYGARMDLAIFFVASFLALEIIGLIMAGWAANSKWSLYGAMRQASQMVSYEIPLGITIAAVAAYAGSLAVHPIVEQQANVWFIFQSPFLFVAFFVFYIAALASTKRAPFDLPEAESELVAGFHTEYSGMRFSFFFLAEYASMYVVSALAVVLFLGGWYGPIPMFWLDYVAEPGSLLHRVGSNLIGLANLLGKSYFLILIMIQLRWTLPRIRIDQVMSLCWKYLLPIAMICAAGATVQGVLMELYL